MFVQKKNFWQKLAVAALLAAGLAVVTSCDGSPDDSDGDGDSKDNGTPPGPPKEYTVTFNSNGGSAVDKRIVIQGERLVKPDDPVRAVYTVEGWYRDNNTFRRKWDFDTDTVTANVTLFAKWELAPFDPDFHVYICFGQSNMEGANLQWKDAVDNYSWINDRFRLLQPYDTTFPSRRLKDQWYTASPPLMGSNWCGICPADFFGRHLVENTPENIKIGVFLVNLGGGKLNDWHPEDGPHSWVKEQIAAGKLGEVQNWIRYDREGKVFRRMIDLGKQAQKVGVIKGILLHQGESGCEDYTWTDLLKEIYGAILEELELEPIPILVGEAAWGRAHTNGGRFIYPPEYPDALPGVEFPDDDPDKNPYIVMNDVLPPLFAQSGWEQFHYIPTMDIEDLIDGIPYEYSNIIVDHAHFSNSAQEIIGKRYGEKMYDLLYKDK
jgi:uncharacterized repeat protein (TIGR02543 family)